CETLGAGGQEIETTATPVDNPWPALMYESETRKAAGLWCRSTCGNGKIDPGEEGDATASGPGEDVFSRCNGGGCVAAGEAGECHCACGNGLRDSSDKLGGFPAEECDPSEPREANPCPDDCTSRSSAGHSLCKIPACTCNSCFADVTGSHTVV